MSLQQLNVNSATSGALPSVMEPPIRPTIEGGALLKTKSSAQYYLDEFNEKLTLETGIISNLQQRFYPNSLAGQLTNWNFNLGQWCEMNRTTITFGVQWSLYDSTTSQTLTQAQINNFYTALNTSNQGFGNIYHAFLWNYPQNPWAQFFNVFQFKGGSPSVLLNQYGNDTYPNNQYVAYLPSQSRPEDEFIHDKFSNFLKMSSNGNTSTFNIGTNAYVNGVGNSMFFQKSKATHCSPNMANTAMYDFITSAAYNTPQEITLPLKWFIAAFDSPDMLLPPNFPMTAFIIFVTTPIIFATWGNIQLRAQLQLNSAQQNSASNPFFTFYSKQFNATSQAELNVKAISNQLNYNYFETRLLPVTNPNVPPNSNTMNTNLTISNIKPIGYVFWFSNQAAIPGTLPFTNATFQDFLNSPFPNMYINYINLQVAGIQLILMDNTTSQTNYNFLSENDQDLYMNVNNQRFKGYMSYLTTCFKTRNVGIPLFMMLDTANEVYERMIQSPEGPVTANLTIKYNYITYPNDTTFTGTAPAIGNSPNIQLFLNCAEVQHQQLVISGTNAVTIIQPGAKLQGPTQTGNVTGLQNLPVSVPQV